MNNKFLNFTGSYIDDYITDNQLIQCYDYTLGKYIIENNKILIQCYNLFINDEFINIGGEIVVFCKNIYANNNAKISVTGKDSVQFAGKMGQPSGEQRDGLNAFNIGAEGSFQEKLNGGNGGKIVIYCENIEGIIKLEANGGRGATGQEGGDALVGKPGQRGPKIWLGNNESEEDAKIRAAGSNGEEPTIGGNGANGGNGGEAGIIEIFYKNWNNNLDNSLKEKNNINSNGGIGGDGGGWGLGNFGGDGGDGGEIWIREEREGPDGWPYTSEYKYDAGNKGYSWDDENGQWIVGRNGQVGKKGLTRNNNIPVIESSGNLLFSFALNSNYFRSLILTAEDFYINNAIEKAAEIFKWILEIEKYLKASKAPNLQKPSLYYALFEIKEFEPYFSKSKIFLNQIKQGNDFFGNGTNYVTLLDNSFINNTILSYKDFIVDFENLLVETLNDDLVLVKNIANVNQVKNSIQFNINNLKEENSKLINVLESLNDEIIGRLNQIDTLKKRISQAEQAFKDEVKSATKGCSLEETLGTITKLVTIAVAISSGVGAIGVGAAVLSGTAELTSDFNSKFNKTNPGFDISKWKQMYELGSNADKTKDTSLINKVDIIKKQGGEFIDDINKISDSFNSSKDSTNNLISLPIADINNKDSKQQFIEQMKDFIDKYPTAKKYQDEVLGYFDYCDVTNQKRLNFTSSTLNVMHNTENILIYENDIFKINSGLFSLDEKKLTSSAKTLIIDSYLRMRTSYIKLLYLFQKSIDYLTLKTTLFSADFYNGSVKAIGSTYTDISNKLVQHLNVSSKSPTPQNNFNNPIELTDEQYPFAFKELRESKFDENIKKQDDIIFNFSLFPDTYGAYGLDNIREIKIKTVRVFFEGAITEKGEISFDLKHSGNSSFITEDNVFISFSHQPIKKPLRYKLNEKNEYKNQFEPNKTNYQLAELKDDYYVGISPFANWTIFINNSIINKGLDLTSLKKILIVFEYEGVSKS